MNDLFIIILSAVFVNNVILMQFLGMCPFFGVSKSLKPALGMSAAVTFVMTIASFVTWLVYWLVLEPLSAQYLKIVIFIFVIASLVQLVELVIKKYSQPLYKTLGIYLPLITTNCAILGVAFLNITNEYNLFNSIVYGFSAGVGFTIALLLMAGIRERLELGETPKAMQGAPIAFITASLISLAFLGLKSFMG
ncbi:MAG: electron transport complex subunit RsxA [Candidatus Nanoarchaeia archaeon]